MKVKNIVSIVILGLLITACNTTPKKVKLVKKPLVSDHYLLMTLVDRPITADQQMMLAFANQRETNYGDVFVNAVSIKGPKFIDNSAPQNLYDFLISNDINSVSIQGPINDDANKI